MESATRTHFLRHTLATLAYRGGKTLSGAPESFAEFRVSPTSRTPVQILAHIGDLLDWAAELVDGKYIWHESVPLPWDQEVDRFFSGLKGLDDKLAATETTGYPAEILFQGPIADALTHVGQLAFMRRLVGSPVRGESYARAEIVIGRVGRDQSSHRVEFD